MDNPTKVMLVEDHPSYRRVIERALSSCSTIELTSMFGAAEIALRNLNDPATTNPPDIILLDLNLPGISGLDSIESFLKAAPSTKIIVLTQSEAGEDVQSAIRKGAQGYLLKSSTVAEIVEGIETVSCGGASIDKAVAAHVLKMIHDKSDHAEPSIVLSSREREILILLSRGLVKKQIAEELDISYGSVATYIRRIYEKFDVQNAAAAVDMAHRGGLLNRDQN
ncbi:response regulator transcription factor [bacterium]|nr:response regulator transcription factor [bacterium]